MRKIVSLLALLIAFCNLSYAQEPATPAPGGIAGAYKVLGKLYVDSLLYIPVMNDTPGPGNFYYPKRAGALMVRFQSGVDTSLYWFNKQKWVKAGTVISGGGSGTLDSVLMATKYDVDTAKTNIRNSIPAQINLIAGTSIAITGTYPNKTISVTGTIVSGINNNAAIDSTSSHGLILQGALIRATNSGGSLFWGFKGGSGTDPGDGNTGVNVIGFGPAAANGNTANGVNAMGFQAAKNNSGSGNINAFGPGAAFGNSGHDNNFMGSNAGTSNTFNYLNIFGPNATADSSVQAVFGGAFAARFHFGWLTATRKWTMPDASGIIPLTVNGVSPNRNGNILLSAQFDSTLYYKKFQSDSITAQIRSEISSISTLILPPGIGLNSAGGTINLGGDIAGNTVNLTDISTGFLFGVNPGTKLLLFGGDAAISPYQASLDYGSGIMDFSLFEESKFGRFVTFRGVTYQMPSTGGAANDVLTNDGGNSLSWAPPVGGVGGSGTVLDVTSHDLSPLFTSSISAATTHPDLTFTLTNTTANTIFGRRSGTGAPSYVAFDSTQIAIAGPYHTQGYNDLRYAPISVVGTVTTFSSGNLSPLFTTSVSTATITPAQTFALSNAAASTVFGRFTSTGAPSYITGLDSSFLATGFHTQNYYDLRFAPITSNGTVTNFTAGNLSPLFTSSVATSTTTPAHTFSLTSAGGYTFFGRLSGSGTPAYQTPDSAFISQAGAYHTQGYFDGRYAFKADIPVLDSLAVHNGIAYDVIGAQKYLGLDTTVAATQTDILHSKDTTTMGDLSPLFTSTNTKVRATNNALSFSLTNSTAYKVFGRAASTGAPSYIGSLDSNFLATGFHTQNYFDMRYAPVAITGTVTTFSSGNLSPLFTTSVATATSTPAQTFSLTSAAASTVFGRFTSTGAPSYITGLDSSFLATGFHTQNYFDLRYAGLNFAANTMRVNATGSSAAPTEVVFHRFAEQTYTVGTTGAVTWTAGAAPSGTATHTYGWSQKDKEVTLVINLNYGTSGTTATAVVIDLPSDCPAPHKWTGFTAASNYLYTGSGQLRTSVTAGTTSFGANMRNNPANTGTEIACAFGSATVKIIQLTITYMTD